MLKKFMGLAAFAVLSSTVFGGEEIFEAKKLSDLLPTGNLTCANEVFTGKGGYRVFQSKQMFKLNPNKNYKISGEFRVKAGTPAPHFYIGLVPFDQKNRQIMPYMVNVVRLCETKLAKAAAVGDKALYLQNAGKWPTHWPFCYLAFNVKAQYADLPNFDAVALVKGKAVAENGAWKLALRKPLTKAYPAGTYVRLHRSGDSYIYCGNNLKATENWTKFQGVISGKALKHGISRKQLWPGTSQVRFLFMALGGKGKSIFEFKDMEIEVQD